MKKKHKVHFVYTIDSYQAGRNYELELDEIELKRLLRRGCIFASEDAQLTKVHEVTAMPEEKEAPKKEEAKEKKSKGLKAKKEEDKSDVDNKKSVDAKAKVQAKSTDK